jgi:hypothetical protein
MVVTVLLKREFQLTHARLGEDDSSAESGLGIVFGFEFEKASQKIIS